MLCVSLKRKAKSLPIVLPIGWAVIKTKKNQFKSRFPRGFIKDETILSTFDPTPSSSDFVHVVKSGEDRS